MNPINVKVFQESGAALPRKGTEGAAGYDVCALLAPDIVLELKPGARLAVPTGLYFEIPPGYFISLRPRSGLALRQGVTLLNSPATIDSDYRGELKVILVNLGQDPVYINNGDRVAQLLLEQSVPLNWESLEKPEELGESERGTGGFGSTGVS